MTLVVFGVLAVLLLMVLLLLVVLAVPFILEMLRHERGAGLRAKAPGQFADLSQGTTHFSWHGAADKPIAVCVHGLTTPSFVFEGVVQGLVDKGYCVLTYDLYGRGFSDAPHGSQDVAFFNTQLSDLLDQQDIDEKVTLIGYSMGGAIVTHWAAQNVERVQRVALLAPAGMGHNLGQVAERAVQPGFATTWQFFISYPGQLRAGIRAEQGHPSSVDNISIKQLRELHHRGYLRSVLASLRGILSHSTEQAHRTLAATQIPVQAIWAAADTVIPCAGLEKLAAWNAQAEQQIVEGAEHGLVYSHTKEVLKYIPGAG